MSGTKSSQSSAFLDIPPIPISVCKGLDADKLMKLTFRNMMDSGNFVDTKFYAYSRRRRSGTVHAPKAIYTNSFILRAKVPEYFEPLLQGGFDAHSIVGPMDAEFPDEFPEEMDGDGYESDSDLEDDDDDEQPAVGTTVEALSQESKPVAAKAGIDPECDKPGDQVASVPAGNIGRVRLVRTVAYTTWRAFLYWVATGEIAFAPLRSQKQDLSAAHSSDALTGPPACSPKSLYSLAEQIGLDDLKKRAKEDIKAKLSSHNILTEIFSNFAARHAEIRDIQLEFLCAQAREELSSNLHEVLTDRCTAQHTALIVASIVKKLVDGPVNIKPRPTGCTNCGRYDEHENFTLVCGSCRSDSWLRM